MITSTSIAVPIRASPFRCDEAAVVIDRLDDAPRVFVGRVCKA